MQKPYHIQYNHEEQKFCNFPLWLQEAIEEKRVACYHPEKVVEDIWDLTWSYTGVPTLIVIETGKEFRMGGAPITYKDVYGDNNVN